MLSARERVDPLERYRQAGRQQQELLRRGLIACARWLVFPSFLIRRKKSNKIPLNAMGMRIRLLIADVCVPVGVWDNSTNCVHNALKSHSIGKRLFKAPDPGLSTNLHYPNTHKPSKSSTTLTLPPSSFNICTAILSHIVGHHRRLPCTVPVNTSISPRGPQILEPQRSSRWS